MRIRVYDKHLGSYFQSEVYAIINTGYYEKYLVSVPSENGGYMKLYDYLDKSDKKLPVLVNMVTPQGPEGWIYKKTEDAGRQFEEYRHVLEHGILFFEYRGFPWLWEDTDTLGALLRGESVLIKDSIFEDRLYSDTALKGWNYVKTQEDADAFQRSVCGFHDAVIRGLGYVSGAYVTADKCMKPLADVRRVSIQIQSQQCQDFEMIFEGVTALNLRPPGDNYMADIYDASLFVRDASVFFSDSYLEKPDMSYVGTWITAYGLRWRFT